MADGEKREQQHKGHALVFGQMEGICFALGQGGCNEVACQSVNSEVISSM